MYHGFAEQLNGTQRFQPGWPCSAEDIMTCIPKVMEIRRADARGVAEHGCSSSRHTFSFANYYDPTQPGSSDLLDQRRPRGARAVA